MLVRTKAPHRNGVLTQVLALLERVVNTLRCGTQSYRRCEEPQDGVGIRVEPLIVLHLRNGSTLGIVLGEAFFPQTFYDARRIF